MNDPYSVLGIAPGADEETIKKAYRQKCKQYHPDLHPGDARAEEKFKEVQAAYSEVLRRKDGGGAAGGYGGGQQSGYSGAYRQQTGYSQGPGFGFGFGPFGFGFYGEDFGRSTYAGAGQESPEMQAAGNYIRNRYYQEALHVLDGISLANRNARWHYYAALAHYGLGNNIRAREEARTAVEKEPGNYTYQNLLDQLQNPGRAYATGQRSYSQPTAGPAQFCLTMILCNFLCNFGRCCCCIP